MEYTFWFAAVTHDVSSQFIADILRYLDPSASLIVALETAQGVHKSTNGQHYHVAAQITNKQWNAYKEYLVDHYQLAGKNNKQGKAHYGKIKIVRDEFKFLSYTVKDQNIYYHNIDLQTIQKYIQGSFKKPKENYQDTLLDYLANSRPMFTITINPYRDMIDIAKLEKLILEHYLQQKDIKTIQYNKLFYYTLTYLQKHESHDIEQIYGYMKFKY